MKRRTYGFFFYKRIGIIIRLQYYIKLWMLRVIQQLFLWKFIPIIPVHRDSDYDSSSIKHEP